MREGRLFACFYFLLLFHNPNLPPKGSRWHIHEDLNKSHSFQYHRHTHGTQLYLSTLECLSLHVCFTARNPTCLRPNDLFYSPCRTLSVSTDNVTRRSVPTGSQPQLYFVFFPLLHSPHSSSSPVLPLLPLLHR